MNFLYMFCSKLFHRFKINFYLPSKTFLALVILASSWSYGLAWIVSAGEPMVNNKTTGFVQYTPDTFLFWMRFYHVFGLLWLAQFVMACQHMVIAGAVAGWYFSRYYLKCVEHFVLNNFP